MQVGGAYTVVLRAAWQCLAVTPGAAAAAGVGELLLADGDAVEISNLQRQIAHTEADLGRAKVASAAAAIARLNARTRVTELPRRLGLDELRSHAARVDLIVDASDSFATRLDINRACREAGTPWVSGAAVRSEGQVAVFDTAAGSACYRCLYPQGEEERNFSCAENGVLAPVVGVVGTLQALEAVKLLAGFGEPIVGSMLSIDAWSLQVRRVGLRRNPRCPHCGPDAASG